MGGTKAECGTSFQAKCAAASKIVLCLLLLLVTGSGFHFFFSFLIADLCEWLL